MSCSTAIRVLIIDKDVDRMACSVLFIGFILVKTGIGHARLL